MGSNAFDGPVELVSLIFGMAARQEKSTALNLVRVCKAARAWISPILYETVELDNPSAVRFESMLDMPSSLEVASLVKNMRATCLPDVRTLSNRCPKIRAMTFASYDVHQLHRLALPSLTHLTVSGFLRYSHFSPGMSVFANITHLRFPNDVPRLPDSFGIAMPNLTHFSCCYCLLKVSQHRELENCLNIVIAAPKLHVAVVYVHNHTRWEVEDLVADVRATRDPKVVVASSDELPDEWQNLAPTYESLWTFADDKIEARSSLINH